MEIVVRLDVMLALRKMKSRELADRVGITERTQAQPRQIGSLRHAG